MQALGPAGPGAPVLHAPGTHIPDAPHFEFNIDACTRDGADEPDPSPTNDRNQPHQSAPKPGKFSGAFLPTFSSLNPLPRISLISTAPTEQPQRYRAAKWSYHEERFFFEYLRVVKGSQTRDEIASGIAAVFKTKDATEVGAYYDNLYGIVRRHVKKELDIKKYSLERIHYTFVVYWEKVLFPAREAKYKRLTSKDSKDDTTGKKSLNSDGGNSKKSKKSKKQKTAGSGQAPDSNYNDNTPSNSICLEEAKPPQEGVATTTTGGGAGVGAGTGAVASSGALPTHMVQICVIPENQSISAFMQQHKYTGVAKLTLPANTCVDDVLEQLASAWNLAIPSSRCLYFRPPPGANIALRGTKWMWSDDDDENFVTIHDILSLLPPQPSSSVDPPKIMYGWDLSIKKNSNDPVPPLRQQQKKKGASPQSVVDEDEDPVDALRGAVEHFLSHHRAIQKRKQQEIELKRARMADDLAAAAAENAKADAAASAKASIVNAKATARAIAKDAATDTKPAAAAPAPPPPLPPPPPPQPAPPATQTSQRPVTNGPMMQMLLDDDICTIDDDLILAAAEAAAAARLAVVNHSKEIEKQRQLEKDTPINTSISGQKRNRIEIEEQENGENNASRAKRPRVPVGLRNLMKNSRANRSPKKKKKKAPPPPPSKAEKPAAPLPAPRSQPPPPHFQQQLGAMPLPAGMAPYLHWNPPPQMPHAPVLQAQPQPPPMYMNWQQAMQMAAYQQQQQQMMQQQYAAPMNFSVCTPQQQYMPQPQPLPQQQPPPPPPAQQEQSKPKVEAQPEADVTPGEQRREFSIFKPSSTLDNVALSDVGESLLGMLFDTVGQEVNQPEKKDEPKQQPAPAEFVTPGKNKSRRPGSAASDAGHSVLRTPLENWACLSPPPNFKLPPDFNNTPNGTLNQQKENGASLLPSTSLLGFMDSHPKVHGATAAVMQKGVEALFQHVTSAVPGGAIASNGFAIGEDDENAVGAAVGGASPGLHGRSFFSVVNDKSQSNWMDAFEISQDVDGGEADAKADTEPVVGDSKKKGDKRSSPSAPNTTTPAGPRHFAALFGGA